MEACAAFHAPLHGSPAGAVAEQQRSGSSAHDHIHALPLARPRSLAPQDVTDKFVPAELPEWLYKTVEAALEVYAAAK